MKTNVLSVSIVFFLLMTVLVGVLFLDLPAAFFLFFFYSSDVAAVIYGACMYVSYLRGLRKTDSDVDESE